MRYILCKIRPNFMSRKRFSGGCALVFWHATGSRRLLFFGRLKYRIRAISEILQRLARSSPRPLIALKRVVDPFQRRFQRHPGFLPRFHDRPIQDRKSTRLNSSHSQISYAVFCLKKKKTKNKSLGTIKKKNKYK